MYILANSWKGLTNNFRNFLNSPRNSYLPLCFIHIILYFIIKNLGCCLPRDKKYDRTVMVTMFKLRSVDAKVAHQKLFLVFFFPFFFFYFSKMNKMRKWLRGGTSYDKLLSCAENLVRRLLGLLWNRTEIKLNPLTWPIRMAKHLIVHFLNLGC